MPIFVQLWNELVVPILWVAGTLASIAAIIGLFRLFGWIMDKLG